MSVVNMYDLLPKTYIQKPYYNPNKLTPQHPFRLCIVGVSNSGKTNILLNLIEDARNFHKIYLYARKLTEPLYQYLIDYWEKKSSEVKKTLIEYSSDISDVITPESLDESIQSLIILDDMVTQHHLHCVQDLFIRGRKYSASITFITQSYFGVPTPIRSNCDYFIFTRNLRGNELTQIAKDQSSSLTKEKFKELYAKATQEGYNFLLVDNQSTDPCKHFRRNFNFSLVTNEEI